MELPQFVRDLLLGVGLVIAGAALILSSWLLGFILFITLGLVTIGAGIFAPFRRKMLGAKIFLVLAMLLDTFILGLYLHGICFGNG